MEAKRLVAIDEYCSKQSIETSFIFSLQKSGLIEVTTIKNNEYLDLSQLNHIEKFIVLHYELDINLEGIETIDHLLKRIESMSKEIIYLRNKLRSVDTDDVE
jgi:chaperone modulatory protein CbpM